MARSTRSKVAFLFLGVSLLTLSVNSRSARAAEGNGIFLGIVAGAGVVNSLTSFAYGMQVGYQTGPHISLGLMFSSLGLGVPSGVLAGYGASSVVTSLIFEPKYHFTDFLAHLYLAPRLGLVFSSSTLEGPALSLSAADSNLAFGAGIGAAFPLAGSFTIGPEANLTLVGGASLVVIHLIADLIYHF